MPGMILHSLARATRSVAGGMLFTFLIGKSADVYGYDPLFVALAALNLVGAVVLWALLRGRK